MSEQNKMGKLINVPQERWGKKPSETNKELRALCPLDFSFSRVPFDVNGSIDELFDPQDRRVKKAGVEHMEIKDIESIPYDYSNPYNPVAHGLKLDDEDINDLNSETNGFFLRFLEGGEGGRYVLLRGNKKKELDVLKSYLPKIDDQFLSKFLEIFLQNAEKAIIDYGDEAALVVI